MFSKVVIDEVDPVCSFATVYGSALVGARSRITRKGNGNINVEREW